jgi:hypothetical protein
MILNANFAYDYGCLEAIRRSIICGAIFELIRGGIKKKRSHPEPGTAGCRTSPNYEASIFAEAEPQQMHPRDQSSVSCTASTLSGLIGHPYRSRKWSIEGAVGLQVEPAVEVAPPGAGKHQVAAAGSTGQHSANICGRTGLGDIQAGKLRRRSTKVQQEPEQ